MSLEVSVRINCSNREVTGPWGTGRRYARANSCMTSVDLRAGPNPCGGAGPVLLSRSSILPSLMPHGRQHAMELCRASSDDHAAADARESSTRGSPRWCQHVVSASASRKTMIRTVPGEKTPLLLEMCSVRESLSRPSRILPRFQGSMPTSQD